MAIDIYSTATLLPVLRTVKTRSQFWTKWFPTAITFTTEEIYFDKVFTDSKALAPFVLPNVQGRMMGQTGYTARSFRPAYVKPKNVVDPNMLIPRMAGEGFIDAALSPAQRKDAQIASMLAMQKLLIENRLEWMAAKAMADGGVTIVGEDYPSTFVDFRRDASLTYVLAGAARWNQVGALPMADIKAARINVNNRSGARVTVLVFGQLAWDSFAARVDLKEMQNKNYGGQETRVTLISDGFEGQEYMGSIQGYDGAGRIEAWVDTSKYKDENGAEQFYLEQNTVVGTSMAVEGVQAFGAIKDLDANLQAMRMFPKVWRVDDPSAEYMMTQSSPLLIPKQPDATFSIKVQ